MSRRRRLVDRAPGQAPHTTTGGRDWRAWITAAALLGLFATLALVSERQRSATWDEPIHLTAGYVALTEGDYRIDPSHPPLLRMWAALPVLALSPNHPDTRPIDSTPPDDWLSAAYQFAHRFLYDANDADRLLHAGRLMIVGLATLLGVILFIWTREWFGLAPAAVVLALFAIEPNLLVHGSLVTTDLGVTTFVFATVYFLRRACERPNARDTLAAAACAGLAVTSKFTGMLLVPIVAVLLAFAVVRQGLRLRTAAGIGAAMAAGAFAMIWAVYGFHFQPSASPGWVFDFTEGEFAASAPTLATLVEFADRLRLLPNAFTHGLLYTQASVASMPAFLAGEISTEGWWYYFPIAFLIKTPIAVIALAAAGIAIAVLRVRASAGPLVFALVPAGICFAAAMASGVNLGVRHILPVYPFVLLLAGAAASALLASPRRWARAAMAAILVIGVAEVARAYPHTLSFFNQFVGGPANGYRYLADSNLGWGGNLKRLKQWMDSNGVEHVNLAYFGQADPEYYMIDCTHLPGAPSFAVDAIARPKLPGYVALSPTIMHGVYSPAHWRLFYAPFEELEPVATIGNSLRVYWVERWPDPVGTTGEDVSIEAHRTLGDALLFGLQWPSRAVVHYREYLRHNPRDAGALVQLGTALVASGSEQEAMGAFRAAVEAQPEHGEARLMLARALFASRQLADAATHAERAVQLLPASADAHDLLGRVRAVQGRYPEAMREFRQALAIDPSHAAAREHVARLERGP